MKILTIVGARPQFVKAAVVSRALEAASVDEVLLHTGQHFDANMSDLFFSELSIPEPRYNLGIGGGSHAANTGRAMEGIEKVIEAEEPDVVLVYGDTDATLAGAVAAAKLFVPVAHVEAGLRSFNRRMPEEVNRVLTDHVSNFLFAPTEVAVANLRREGILEAAIHLPGDVMYDAVLHYGAMASDKSHVLDDLKIEPRKYILATVHRKENTDDPGRLSGILDGLAAAGQQVILPLHPRTRNRLSEMGMMLPVNVRSIDPVGYLDMLQLQSNARMIATDSGGMQKEGYFNGVHCAVLRDETEWTELIDNGFNRLVGTDADAIARTLNETDWPVADDALYGDGRAGEFIAHILKGI